MTDTEIHYECCDHCLEIGCPEAMTGHTIVCPEGCPPIEIKD